MEDSKNLSTIIVHKGYAGRMFSSKRGKTITYPPKAVKISIGGVIWSSPIPENIQELEFFIQATERIEKILNKKEST